VTDWRAVRRLVPEVLGALVRRYGHFDACEASVAKTLRQITTALGLRRQTVRPQAQDLRHTFAIRTLIDWQRSGQIAPRIATLSTTSGTSARPRRAGTCRRPRS
jgi:hypothetical protein